MAQENRAEQPVRLPNPGVQPFVASLKTVRFFTVLFFWVAMVCLAAHVTAFVLAEWVGLYEPPSETAPADDADAEPPEPDPADGEAAAPAPLLTWVGGTAHAAETDGAATGDAEDDDTATVTESRGGGAEPVDASAPTEAGEWAAYYEAVSADVLRVLRVLGILASVLLVLSVFIYLQIALLGRLEGVRQLTRALFYLLVFLVTVVPWYEVFEDQFPVGSFYAFEDLMEARTALADAGEGAPCGSQACYLIRFFAVPVFGVLLLALAGLAFGRGYADSVVSNE